MRNSSENESLKYYLFNQNNSGGSFVVDNNLCHRVMIQARNEQEANNIAEEMGVYFNGCERDMDCECCGDRWYHPDEMTFPYTYGAFNDEEQAQTIVLTYNAKMVKSKKKTTSTDKRKYFDIIFPTPESYLQYMADEHGWTKPDGRIFYKGGRVVSVYKDK